MTDITSPSNERIKALVRLRERRHRDATGTFVIEGERELSRARRGNVEIIEVFVCPDLGADSTGDDVVTVSTPAFEKVSRRQNPDGVIGVAKQWSTNLDDIVAGANPLLLVAEAIEKPGNLGAMLRTADAAGVDAVIVCDPVVDFFNPNVVRASQGSLFSVPVAVAPVAGVLGWLDGNAIAVVAMFPDAATSYSEVDLTGSTAIVVGAESTGLSDVWREAGTAAALPMAGAADSLNAATAVAVVAYEAVRQRS